MSISNQLLDTAQNIPKIHEAGQLAILDESEYMHPTVVGSVIAVNDVNDIKHNLGVRVESKNLIPYPYTNTTKTVNGVSFTDNGDGTITVNGTATETAHFYCFLDRNNMLPLKGKTITFSGCPTGGDTSSYYLALSGENTYIDTGSGKTQLMPHDCHAFYIRVATGAMVDNLVFKPQIEFGNVTTTYTPYVADVNGVEVSRYGKNLWNGNVIYVQNVKHENGVFTQTYDDAKTRLEFFIQAYMGSTYKKQLLYRYMDDAEIISVSFVKDDTLDRIRMGHNGSNHNVICMIDISDIPNGTYTIQVNITNATKGNYSWQDIQIEPGTTATDYEPYIEPQTATADKEGVVNGLTSLSPNMTLTSNTTGVAINCQYYRDIDTYINNLATNIALTGGN